MYWEWFGLKVRIKDQGFFFNNERKKEVNDMQNELVSEIIFIRSSIYMDCPTEGSGIGDCDCDLVDGS